MQREFHFCLGCKQICSPLAFMVRERIKTKWWLHEVLALTAGGGPFTCEWQAIVGQTPSLPSKQGDSCQRPGGHCVQNRRVRYKRQRGTGPARTQQSFAWHNNPSCPFKTFAEIMEVSVALINRKQLQTSCLRSLNAKIFWKATSLQASVSHTSRHIFKLLQ